MESRSSWVLSIVLPKISKLIGAILKEKHGSFSAVCTSAEKNDKLKAGGDTGWYDIRRYADAYPEVWWSLVLELSRKCYKNE